MFHLYSFYSFSYPQIQSKMMENGGKKGDTWAEISQQKSSSEGGSGEVVGGSAVSNKGVGGQVGGGGYKRK